MTNDYMMNNTTQYKCMIALLMQHTQFAYKLRTEDNESSAEKGLSYRLRSI